MPGSIAGSVPATIAAHCASNRLVCDYWFARRGGRLAGRVLTVNWNGVLAWALGVAVMLALLHPIRNVLGIVAAALAYGAATALRPRAAAASGTG